MRARERTTHMNKIVSAALALSLALAHPATADLAPTADADFNVSGGMTPNADGTASFEFRVANDRADITVTGFTVTVAFYDRTVAPANKLAEYQWSFVGQVPPNTQSLEYGVLVQRHTTAAGHPTADPLATAIYTYKAKIDGQAATPNN
jgi:hypothetical protein